MPRYAAAAPESPAASGFDGSGSRWRLRSVERSTALTNPVALCFLAACEIDRIVHDGRRGHAVEMKQLIEAEANDQQDVGVEPGDRTAGEMLDEMVEAPLAIAV